MKKILCVLAITCALVSNAFAAEKWGYGDQNGPDTWGQEFPACKTGGNQTPVNIVPSKFKVVTNHQPLTLKFDKPASNIVNNGHSLQVNFSATGNTVMIGSESYRVVQFHFHSPSENVVDHHHFPMELHLVLQAANGHMAVIAVFFKEGKANPALAKLWQHIPTKVGATNDLSTVNINYAALLPSNLNYQQLEGSLTTPPCTHGLTWHILTTPMTLSKAQLAEFRKYYHGNIRSLQPMAKGAVITVEAPKTKKS